MDKEQNEYIDSVTELLMLERLANYEFHTIEIDKISSILTAGTFSFLGLIVINIKNMQFIFDIHVLYNLLGVGIVCLLTGMWVKYRSSICKSMFLMHNNTKDLVLNKKNIKNYMSENAYEYYLKHSSKIDVADEMRKLEFPSLNPFFRRVRKKGKYDKFKGAKVVIRNYQLQKFLFSVQSFEIIILLAYVMFSLNL